MLEFKNKVRSIAQLILPYPLDPYSYEPCHWAAKPGIRCRTWVAGAFPDGNSALMLVCARVRHVTGTQWGSKKYMSMKILEAVMEDSSIAGCFIQTGLC